MNRRDFLKHLAIAGGAVFVYGKFLSSQLLMATPLVNEAKKNSIELMDYHRIVVLGDPHLPSRVKQHPSLLARQRIMNIKNEVRDDINAWEDVEQVNVVGDIVARVADDEEYVDCKTYFDEFKQPVYFITGNHDYLYNSSFSPDMPLVSANATVRQQKLERFKKTWNLPELFYTQKLGKYLLVYLSVDSLESSNLTEMSERQLKWLRETLSANQATPTILFFHGPLNGTLSSATNKFANTPNFIAQPEEEIRNIINQHDQILLWVSGHTHTPATDPSFASDVNLYEGRVTNIHNSDMDRTNIWTNSLYLYSDKIVVRSFDHRTKNWMENLERAFIV